MVYSAAVLLPLLSTLAYRRDGRPWRSALGLGGLAVLCSVVAGIIAGLVFGFGVTVEAGLCGTTPWEALAAGALAYVVVASWAAMRASRVWAWGPAAAAAIAVAVFVSYFFASAHGYCET